MQIIDSNGMPITVTDLPAAIKQAVLFIGCSHQDNEFASRDDQLRAYWMDIYTKLLKIQSKYDISV